MKRVDILKFLILVLLLTGIIDASGSDYSLSQLKHSGQSRDGYYDSLSTVPNIYIERRCYKDCSENCCYDVLADKNGRALKSYSTSDSLGLIVATRYEGIAYLLYSRSYGSGKNRVTDYHLVNDRLNSYRVPKRLKGAFDSLISKDAALIQIAKDGLYVNGIKSLEEMDFTAGKISNNLNGDITVAAIDNLNGLVYVSNLEKWLSSGIELARHSDRENILALYPQDKNSVYATAYNLINVYNKGLMGSHVDFASGSSNYGWIYNSQKQNIGFDPKIYLDRDSNVHISADNSSSDTKVYFDIPNSAFNGIDKNSPERDGFEDESILDLMVGTGFSHMSWIADSKVENSDVKTVYATTEYDISNSMYKEVYFQGRILDYQLAISYMQNEAEQKGGLTKKANSALNMYFDINSLISDSSSLRIGYSKSEVNGVTTFIDNNNGATNITASNAVSEFTTELQRFSLLVIKEKGYYYGIEYTSFTTPSAIGFSGSSKNIEYYGLDNELGIKNIEVVFGYDTAAYAKRYESDYRDFYLQSLFGIGMSFFDLSSEFKNTLQDFTSKTIVKSSSYSYVVDLEVEAGYIWQERFKSIKGLGYSFELGYKVRGIYTSSGQSSDSEDTIEANELEIEMNRYDIWHGPYVNVNIIF